MRFCLSLKISWDLSMHSYDDTRIIKFYGRINIFWYIFLYISLRNNYFLTYYTAAMDILFTSQVKICKYIVAIVNRKKRRKRSKKQNVGSLCLGLFFCKVLIFFLSDPIRPSWLNLFVQLRSAWKSEKEYLATVHYVNRYYNLYLAHFFS